MSYYNIYTAQLAGHFEMKPLKAFGISLLYIAVISNVWTPSAQAAELKPIICNGPVKPFDACLFGQRHVQGAADAKKQCTDQYGWKWHATGLSNGIRQCERWFWM
jgi:hypothetical protein